MRRPNCIFWSNRCLRTAHEKSWLAEKKSETVFFLSKIEVTVSCAPAKTKKTSLQLPRPLGASVERKQAERRIG